MLIFHMAFLFSACALHAEGPATELSHPEGNITSNPEATEGWEAQAVYYAKKFKGRKTYSGDIFDNTGMTAAHASLPLGTQVKVINIANNRSVIVTINDRCGKRSREIIDLTRAAAEELGFLGKGTAKVIIIPLPES